MRMPLSPQELFRIASDHAQYANYLLQSDVQQKLSSTNTLLPVISLLYTAIELSLKAYIIHDTGKLLPSKNLLDLLHANLFLELSRQEEDLIRALQQQKAFRKGMNYDLWENEQQLLVFCHQILDLFAVIDEQKPIELCDEYL
jgi:hypothetical protein